jgi:transposase-like protein
MVERVAAGWPAAHVAEQLGVSRATVHKWLRRHAEGGDAALEDRSCRPVRMPARTPKRVEQRVLAARRRRRRGAVVLAAELGLNPSTVGRILARYDVPRLASTLVVVDKSDLIAAFGAVTLAVSDRFYFGSDSDSDSEAMRVTFRFGAKAVHPARVVKLRTKDA